VRIGRTTEKRTEMKSTRERLSESYCRPNEIDWKAIELIDDDRVTRHYRDWSICATVGSLLGRTEIPVSHFIDLLHDTIAPWRLEEDGFEFAHGEQFICFEGEHSIVVNEEGDLYIVHDQSEIPLNITTYTDLLTQIRLIG